MTPKKQVMTEQVPGLKLALYLALKLALELASELDLGLAVEVDRAHLVMTELQL